MPYSQSYLDFVLEQLRGVLSAVRVKPMFGGVGIYAQDVFFALIADDVLYFYTHEAQGEEYEARGMQKFGKRYYEVPIGVLEDPEALRLWAEQAITAAKAKHR